MTSKKNVSYNLKTLRSLVVKESCFEKENKWLLDYTYDQRDEAVRDFLKNYKSNMAKYNNTKKPFKLQYVRKKQNESFQILKKHWNKKNNHYTSIYNIKNLKSSESLPKDLQFDSRFIKTSINKYYICLPKIGCIRNHENQVSDTIALDPGVKTFVTGYSPDGTVFECGIRDISRISRLLYYKRKLQHKIDLTKKQPNKNKQSLALLRINNKIHNLVTDLHKKLATWLCKNYKVILLPKLNFHTCKKLNSKSKEKLVSYKHCSFFERLSNKAKEYNSKVIQVNESYTSITCTVCGNQHPNLRNKDVYNCLNCKTSISRDINGARNIYLRYKIKS
jgi:IS605 OrfB family transposase